MDNKHNKNDKLVIYLRNLISRVLISIILVLSISITIKINSENKNVIHKYMFEDSLHFVKIKNWYEDNFGSLVPQTKTESITVFNDDLWLNQYQRYENGVKFQVNKGSAVSLLNGGLVVFIGDKEKYGNTLIIQGNDGINYYYGGITNVNVSLYDYLEKSTLVGECMNDYLYLTLEKDGKYIYYDEYI